MAIYGFEDLDFAAGIHSRDINNRLDALYNWIKRERLRTSGWGIVEGFKLTCDAKNFVVTVGQGTFINKDGDEINVPEKVFGAGELENAKITRTYTVDNDGMVMLEAYPYDPVTQMYITYNPPNVNTTLQADTFYVSDKNGFYIPVVRIEGRKLYVNAKEYRGQEIYVTQRVANDRVDSIMLHPDGTYEYLWSIESPSPSHVDLADYENTYCVAVVYWTITPEGINCDFFTNHRSYRRVYVDDTNTLYLNGEVYKKPKFIYFEEPEEDDRELNDLWYDMKTNTLYIWRYYDGELGWHIVNDHSEIVIKERKIWTVDDNPTDLQTFKFDEEEINLRFVPHTNALDILVDNAPIMDDQYTEIISNDDDISALKDFIVKYEGKIKEQQDKLAPLLEDKKNIEGAIQVLRKDLADSKQLYPALYDEEDTDYQIAQSELPNLRNLMTINQRIAQRVEELATLTEKIKGIQTLIDTYSEQVELYKSVTEGTFVSTGIGFKLTKPLLHAAYVEVTVTHVVRMKPAREMFQRAALFVTEGDITVPDNITQVYKVRDEVVYAVGEDQLEVFLDGIKLSKWGKEFVELADESSPYEEYDYSATEEVRNRLRSASSQHFKIKVPVKQGQTVTYRICKHVWSYDQLDQLIKNIRDFTQEALDKADEALEVITEIQDNITKTLTAIRSDIGIIKEELKKIDQCFKKTDVIPWANLPDKIKRNMVGAPINRWTSAGLAIQVINGITVDTTTNLSTGKTEIIGGDIFSVYYISSTEQRLLICEDPDVPADYVDYWVDKTADATGVQLTLRSDLVSSDAYLYVTGFKRGVED